MVSPNLDESLNDYGIKNITDMLKEESFNLKEHDVFRWYTDLIIILLFLWGKSKQTNFFDGRTDKSMDITIKIAKIFAIIRKAKSYSPVTKSCNRCLTEKLLIAKLRHKENLLNKRTEFVSKCRHENKYVLKNN